MAATRTATRPRPPSNARHHAEWLSLVETSGPFLSMPVLQRVFPQGLDAHDPEHAGTLRLAFAEWEADRDDPAIHNAWVRLVLSNTLEMPDEVTSEGQTLPPALEARIAEHSETLRPDLAIMDPDDSNKARLLVQIYPPGQDLEKPIDGLRWKASPATRMMELLHAADVRLGLVTNGEQWMLVHAPRNETTGYASWYASLSLEEQITLRAFRSLLSARRFFGVPENDTIEALYAESAQNQQEVTDQLGFQVRQAVEILVSAIDSVDQDRNRTLFAGADEKQLYEAALTVMMRLVFLFSAEERGLLLLGDPLYDQHYAVSTLREQLREDADKHGEEILERRHDAYSRLLATFRAVHGGVEHEAMRLPAYGGTLFDPDSYPFLEGRSPGTSWRDEPAQPLPIHNRNVLHLLDALQVLRVKVPGGGPAEARRLSFRALDIEQIGHVYEGLLDHTARRATETVLGITGSKNKEPELPLSTLEELYERGEDAVIDSLKKQTGRSPAALRKALAGPADEGRWRTAFGNDEELAERARTFAGLVRDDMSGYPMVVLAGSVYVTKGSDRRESGTHYTPRSLTEPLVQHTLDPLVYEGPAEGWEKEEWKLRPAAEILALTVCDMAMGSGAFLVQACRYLSERLVEAWETAGEDRAPDDSPLPANDDERLAIARRLVADRCLYGVDKSPLAVEMGKLSLWLITLQKDRPFTFLDHALRSGDSLLGVTSTDQLTHWSLEPEGNRNVPWFTLATERALDTALALRRQLHSFPVHSVRDAEAKARLLREAEEAMELVRLGADLLLAVALQPAKRREAMSDTLLSEFHVQALAHEELREGVFTAESEAEILRDFAELRAKANEFLDGRRPLHWPLEFPEVFVETEEPAIIDGRLPLDAGDLLAELSKPREEVVFGFAAVVGNPPFMGGRQMSTFLGPAYSRALTTLFSGSRGTGDLVAFFLRQGFDLLQLGGNLGLLATKSISETATREIGLEPIIRQGGSIYSADSVINWPGVASVHISKVHIHKGTWSGSVVLNGKRVPTISTVLAESVDLATANRLHHGIRYSEGTKLYGGAFVRTELAREQLLYANPGLQPYLRVYVNGDVLNGTPDAKGDSIVIDFGDRDESEIQGCNEILEELKAEVSQERANQVRQIHEHRPWLHWDKRLDFYSEARKHDRILACAIVSTYLAFVFVHPQKLFAHGIKLFADDRYSVFAVLQSTIHESWVQATASKLRQFLRYSTSTAFDQFPLLEEVFGYQDVTQLGQTYHDQRYAVMRSNNCGTLQIYKRFHNPEESEEDIERLRELHVEMDRTVADAYGWDDLDLGHGFHETKQGLRFTISEEARREVLDRLLLLNHECYAEEVEQGLHDKKTRKGKNKKRGKEQDDGGTKSFFADGA
jgi:hypothetical protein